MNDLTNLYKQVEAELQTFLEKQFSFKEGLRTGQYTCIQKALLKKIRDQSLAQSLNPEEYGQRLISGFNILNDLKNTLGDQQTWGGKPDDQIIWRHKAIEPRHYLGRDSVEPKIEYYELLEVASDYLSKPWMQLNEIDWIVLDSIFYKIFFEFRDAVLSGTHWGNPNFSFIFSDRTTEDYLKTKFKFQIYKWLLIYIFPLLLIFIFYILGLEKVTLATGGAYILFLTFKIIFWPASYFKRKREQKFFESNMEQLVRLVKLYAYCEPPVLSPRILRTAMEKAIDQELALPGVAYALLDRICQENDSYFFPFLEKSDHPD